MNQELIDRFFQGDCSTEEKRIIFDYFNNHPEELAAYFSESEWENFFPVEELDPEISGRMKREILDKISSRSKVILWAGRLSVAASFLVLIGLGWKYFTTEKKELLVAAPIIENVMVAKINETDSIEKITLPDGTLVDLYPKSQLKYRVPFDADARKIILSGIAKFDVFHDAARPFTVVSLDISTTALGTIFMVSAEKGQADIKVNLYKGSVVIKNADSGLHNLDMDYYLKPGQSFIYSRTKKIFGISSIEKKVNALDKRGIRPKPKVSAGMGLNDWYMFNNQSLAMVFDNLKSIYNVNIYYDPKILSGKSFIGKIERNESIENLLSDIARLNGLQVTKNDNSYTIIKK
ncbi:MAG: FecR family protein [Ginsengibacter sp.]